MVGMLRSCPQGERNDDDDADDNDKDSDDAGYDDDNDVEHMRLTVTAIEKERCDHFSQQHVHLLL